ncbi:MAG: single-stranded DNA-binding protein, partial [Acidimicrobiales bacterium]
VADEIGPSLRWATAQVTKNERRSPADGGRPADSSAGPAGGGSGGGGSGGSGGGNRPAPTPATGGYGDDEEPF